MELPWKRNDGDVDVGVKQSEFPTWVENKEYTNYYSPTNTFLGKPILYFNHRMKWFYKDSYVFTGGLDRNPPHPSVIDIFPGSSPHVVAGSSGAEASTPFTVTVSIPEDKDEYDDEKI